MLANLKNSMFSFFSKKKNSKTLEEVKIEKPLDGSENEILNFPKNHSLYDYIKKSEIEKQILLKRRRDPNVSAEYIENSYKKRLIDMNKAISLKTFLQEGNDLSCPICIDVIISAHTTVCGHTFCEQCLLESLLLNAGCPLCRTPLRSFQMTSSKALDQIIEKWVAQNPNKDLQMSYSKRKKDHEAWNESRKIKNVNEADELDVRDTEYIWCVGIILKKITKPNKPTMFLIHYQGWNKIYDEFISENSLRLAPLGFYTKRKDIPQYYLHSPNQDVLYGYVIIGNQNNQNNNINNNVNNNNNIHNDNNINSNNNNNNISLQMIENGNNNNNNLSNEENLPSTHQIPRPHFRRVGYSFFPELSNMLQIRINLSSENPANNISSFNASNEPPPPEHINDQGLREISSISNLGNNEENVSAFNNETNQNLSHNQINPINDTLTVVSFPTNNQEGREAENEILGLIDQSNVNLQI